MDHPKPLRLDPVFPKAMEELRQPLGPVHHRKPALRNQKLRGDADHVFERALKFLPGNPLGFICRTDSAAGFSVRRVAGDE